MGVWVLAAEVVATAVGGGFGEELFGVQAARDATSKEPIITEDVVLTIPDFPAH